MNKLKIWLLGVLCVLAGRIDVATELVLVRFPWLRALCQGEAGLVGKVVGVLVLVVVLGALIPVLWPMMTDTTTDIEAMNGTDVGTTFMQTVWPIALLVIGIGIAAALIMYALKKFGVIGNKM